MKKVIKSLWKRKLTTLLLIAEISISILYFIVVTCEIQQAFRFNIDMPKQISCDAGQLLEVSAGENMDGEHYRKLKKMLMDTKMVENTAILDDTWDCDSNYPMEDIPTFRFTEGAFLMKKFSVQEGRNFDKKDFERNDDTVSVLVGSELAKNRNYDIGDKIQSDYTEETYEITGILKDKSSCFVQGLADGNFRDLDNAMIYPICEEKMEVVDSLHFYCILSDKQYKNEITNLIAGSKAIARIRLEATCVSDLLKDAFLEKYNSTKSWLIVSLVIVLLSAIGVTTIVSSMVYTRKHEIGVKVAVGYSMGQIKSFFIHESIFVTFLSYVISCILGILLIGTGNSGEVYAIGSYITWEVLAYAAVIALIYSILPTLAIFTKFHNVSPKDLIGGRE